MQRLGCYRDGDHVSSLVRPSTSLIGEVLQVRRAGPWQNCVIIAKRVTSSTRITTSERKNIADTAELKLCLPLQCMEQTGSRDWGYRICSVISGEYPIQMGLDKASFHLLSLSNASQPASQRDAGQVHLDLMWLSPPERVRLPAVTSH